MVTRTSWILDAIDKIKASRVEHKRYVSIRTKIGSRLRAILPGELVVLVGPPRVGKSRCICDALAIRSPNIPDANVRVSPIKLERQARPSGS